MAIELPMFLLLSALLWFFGGQLERIIYISGVALLAVMGLHLIRGILKDIKSPSEATYLPYVPALMLAAFVGIFLWF